MPYKKTHAVVQRLAEATAKRRDIAEASQRKTTIDQTVKTALAHALAPNGVVDNYGIDPRVDDGLPPSAPTGITITPLAHALSIEWTPPLYEDRVKVADVSITPDGGLERMERATNLNRHAVIDLEAEVPCSVKVKCTDAFGVSGPYSTPVVGTPAHSVAEEIDIGEAALLGRLQGLLPNENLATIEDFTKFGEGVILGEALAVQEAATFNLWASEAMISSAHIANLEADKIDTGILTAATIFLSATGKLQAGEHTALDAGGIELGLADNFNTPVQDGSYKISGEGDIGALMFFAPTPVSARGDHRGAVLRADGVEGSYGGALILEATAGGNPDVRGARFEVLAKHNAPVGQINAYGDIVMRGRLYIAGGVEGVLAGHTTTTISGTGGTTTFAHRIRRDGVARAPYNYMIQYTTSIDSFGNGNWSPISQLSGFSVMANETNITVTNNTGAAYYLRIGVMG